MSFRITVQPSGHVFVAEAGETVLEAALRQGLELPHSCRAGQCAACVAPLLAGEVAYDEDFPALEDVEEGEALLCQAHPRSDLEVQTEVHVAVDQDIRPVTLPCKVVDKELLCHDVVRLYLKLPPARPLRFRAGQYLDILTADGGRRSFSIASPPHENDRLELHIRHVEGGEFTHYIFHDLKDKTVWRIEAPLGSFYLREQSARPILLMGGGTGFAPLKGIIEHAFKIGLKRPMHLFWGVRSQRDLYLPELPRQWAAAHSNFQFTPVLSEPAAEDDWQGETGFVHEALLRAYPELSSYEIYMGGPPAMIRAAGDAFMERGASPERMFSDSFEFNRLATPKASGHDTA